MMAGMITLILLGLLRGVRTQRSLVLENLALRHQLVVLQRTVPRPRLRTADRPFWVLLSRLWAGWKRLGQQLDRRGNGRKERHGRAGAPSDQPPCFRLRSCAQFAERGPPSRNSSVAGRASTMSGGPGIRRIVTTVQRGTAGSYRIGRRPGIPDARV